MSRAKALLKRFMHELTKEELCSVPDELQAEIEELLAQPEQEQEPVAWKVIDITNGNYMFSRIKPTERSYKYDVVIPLYTSPPKRKHLTGIEISKGFKADDEATHLYSYWVGVDFAEKHHGIGGEE